MQIQNKVFNINNLMFSFGELVIMISSIEKFTPEGKDIEVALVTDDDQIFNIVSIAFFANAVILEGFTGENKGMERVLSVREFDELIKDKILDSPKPVWLIESSLLNDLVDKFDKRKGININPEWN